MFNKKEITEIKNLFLEIGKIDNPSGQEEKVGEFVFNYLLKNGIKSSIDKTNNLFFKIKAKGEAVLLNSHLDSVEPTINKAPVFDGEYFYSKGETILGSDDLAGVIPIIYAITYIKRNKIKHKNLEVLFTAMEEIGGIGLKQFKFSSITAKHGIVVDSTDKVGAIVIKAPSKINFKIKCIGIATHGKEIAKGVSSIKMMGDLISLLPLGVVKKGLYLNIGKINGGKSLNTVPGETTLDGYLKTMSVGEIRGDSGRCQEVVDFIITKICKIRKKYPRGKIEFEYELVRNGYSHNKSELFISHIKDAMRKSKLRPKLVDTFGTSDANTINAMGIKVAMIGMGITGAHTVNEKISLNSIVKLTEILVNYLRAG